MEKYRKLSREEIRFTSKAIESFLEPVAAEVEIDSEYWVLYCSMTSNDKKESWEQYCYPVKIKVQEKVIEASEEFEVNGSLIDTAWLIAYHVFKEIDGDCFSKLGDNLWKNKDSIVESIKSK